MEVEALLMAMALSATRLAHCFRLDRREDLPWVDLCVSPARSRLWDNLPSAEDGESISLCGNSIVGCADILVDMLLVLGR